MEICCPHCNMTGITQTKTFPNLKTLLAMVLIVVIFWPLFWVPLLVDNCKETEHSCSNCDKTLGSVDSFEDCCVTRSSDKDHDPIVV